MFFRGCVVCLSVLVLACSKNSGDPAADAWPVAPMVKPGQHDQIAMVTVAAGEFIMGSNQRDKEGLQQRYGFPFPLFLDEHPERKVHLKAYKIDTYEVSNAQYKEYILKAKGNVPPAWGQNGYGLAKSQALTMDIETLRMIGAEHFKLDMDTRNMEREALIQVMLAKQKIMDHYPVTGVTWFDAEHYCQWRGQRLPTEAQWEKAARGPTGFEFPWGNEWNPLLTNTGDDGKWEDGIAPVGQYVDNKSVYGAYDLSGNVWEWVADWYQGNAGSDFSSKEFGEKNKVIRGGGGGMGHYAISYFFRGASRQFLEPNTVGEDIGFRCVLN